MLITEVHFTDLFPAAFLNFRKKYLPMLRKHQTFGMYVQFSNFTSDTMNRNPYHTPDHNDMVGIYAYPIEYVLRYPADIWYGQGARYMRVLKSHAKKILNLRYIDTESKAERLLNSMGFDYRETTQLIATAKSTYKHKGVTRWGKIALSAIQMDLLNEPLAPAKRSIFGSEPPEYRVRSGSEQSKLFIKAGYDAIEDAGSSNKMAVLNDREPEQIVFLTRAAFRVVEVVDLRPGLPQNQLPTFTTSDPNNPRVERPLAAMIARAMDDQLSEAREYGNRMYWTKNGNRIEIEFERPRSYYATRKMGEKKHKEHKLANPFYVRLKLFTNRGTYETSYGSDETFKAIAEDVAHWWQRKANEQTDWEPETRAAYDAKLQAAEQQAIHQRLDAEHQKRVAELPKFLDDVNWVAARYGLRFEPNPDYEHNADLLRGLDYLANHWRLTTGDKLDISTLDAGLEAIQENWLDAPKTLDLRPQWKQLGDILRTAWEREISKSDKAWLFIRGGSSIFDNIRRYILSDREGA